MSMLGSVQELEDEKMADAYALALAKNRANFEAALAPGAKESSLSKKVRQIE